MRIKQINLAKIAAYLIAALFIFSGFVKGIDPLGTTYKLQDYFEAFGMPFFNPLALPLSIALSSAELLVGLMLLFRVKIRIAAWGALVFMVGFTILTFFSAIFNPVSDCGCFGDALKLTNWETFFKNLVILPLTILIFWDRNKREELFVKRLHGLLAIGTLAFIAVGIALYSLAYKPIIDFRPFKVGVNLKAAMEMPVGAPVDQYKTKLTYKKGDVTKEFDESNYPWQDSTWVFVDSKSVLVKKGYTPPIANFSLMDGNGKDITDLVTDYNGYTFLFILPKIEDANLARIDYIRYLGLIAQMNSHKAIVVSSSDWGTINQFETTLGVPMIMAQADETVLKTIVRSNPGLLLTYKGTIIGKWAWREMPHFSKSPVNPITVALRDSEETKNTYVVIILLLSLILLLVGANKIACKRK